MVRMAFRYRTDWTDRTSTKKYYLRPTEKNPEGVARMRITIDTTQTEKLERELKTLGTKILPRVQARTVTATAFAAREEWQNQMSKKFINRNAWTRRSAQVEKATPATPVARTGSAQGYLATQEFGGTEKKKGKHGVPIPMAAASGESQTPRRRVVRKANRLGTIDLKTSRRTRRKAHITSYLAALDAVNDGQKNIVLRGPGGYKPGIYRIKGREKRKGVFQHVQIKKIFDLSNRTVSIPRNPTLAPATAHAMTSHAGTYERFMGEAIAAMRKKLS